MTNVIFYNFSFHGSFPYDRKNHFGMLGVNEVVAARSFSIPRQMAESSNHGCL